MGGQFGNKSRIQAIVCKGDGHVCFAAAEGEFQVVRLDKTLIVIWLEPDHQLAKGYNFTHDIGSSSNFLRGIRGLFRKLSGHDLGAGSQHSVMRFLYCVP